MTGSPSSQEGEAGLGCAVGHGWAPVPAGPLRSLEQPFLREWTARPPFRRTPSPHTARNMISEQPLREDLLGPRTRIAPSPPSRAGVSSSLQVRTLRFTGQRARQVPGQEGAEPSPWLTWLTAH